MTYYEEYYREICSSDGTIEHIETRIQEHFNFAYDVVDRIASEEPEKLALLHKSCDGTVTRFTFGDISLLSDLAASALESKGIGPGIAVMLLLKRRYEFWIAMMALHKLGAIAVPTSHMVSADDIADRSIAADIRMILCVNSEDICDRVVDAVGTVKKKTGNTITVVSVGRKIDGLLFWNDLMENVCEGSVRRKRVLNRTDSPMLYYFTSGTNGAPKAVMHDWSYPVAHIYTAKNWHGIRENDVHLSVADSGWAKTAWGKLYGQWFLGATVLVYDYDRFYAGELLSLLTEFRVNTFCAPPTVYKYLCMEDLGAYDWSALRAATTAGEPMPGSVAKRFSEATGVTVRDGFGQTETALQICTPVGENGIPGAIGKASPLYNIELVDSENKPVKPYEEGEIVIVPTEGKRPVGVFCGYLGEPERYREVWRGGVYHTGDRARRDPDGYFYFLGRGDDIIKSSGYRIGPSEVEDILVQHPAVKFCAVTGYPSRSRGMVVKASIVLKEGYQGDDKLTSILQDFVKTHAAIYKYPRMVSYVRDLPRTASGKINRAAIRRADENVLRQASFGK